MLHYENGPRTKTALAVIRYIVIPLTSKETRNMHLKVLFFFRKNDPDFKIGQTDSDDLKKYRYGCHQVFTKAEK